MKAINPTKPTAMMIKVSGAILVLVLAGCASNTTKPTSDIGFFSDYSRLEKADAKRGNEHLNYSAPSMEKRAARKVYLMPLRPFPANASFAPVDAALLDQCTNYFDHALRTQLAGRVNLVGNAQDADTAVQPVLTSVHSVEEGRTVLDLVPLRLITRPLKNVAMGKPLQASATLEVRVTEPVSKRVLREAIYRNVGESIGREGNDKTRITFESLRPVLDEWAASVTNDIAPARP